MPLRGWEISLANWCGYFRNSFHSPDPPFEKITSLIVAWNAWLLLTNKYWLQTFMSVYSSTCLFWYFYKADSCLGSTCTSLNLQPWWILFNKASCKTRNFTKMNFGALYSTWQPFYILAAANFVVGRKKVWNLCKTKITFCKLYESFMHRKVSCFALSVIQFCSLVKCNAYCQGVLKEQLWYLYVFTSIGITCRLTPMREPNLRSLLSYLLSR